ncbi:hypothetical protein BVY01_04245 [bacterium I07]|nr:hypothetical protein BVY01_04245 [bacterium I07]
MKWPIEDFNALSETIVQFAARNGADEVEVGLSEGSEFSVEVRNGEIEKLIEAGPRGVALKIIIDKRVANASTSDLCGETLSHLIKNTIRRARLSNPDPYSGLPDKEDILVQNEDLQIYDHCIPDLQAEDKIESAKKLESICLSDNRIQNSFGSSFSTSQGHLIIANSKGFLGSFRQTSVSSGVYLQVGSGSSLFEEGWYDGSRNLKDLMNPESIAEKAIHRATRLLNARKVPTQVVPVILEPPITGGFLGFLYGCINGGNVYLKQSFLAERLHEQIAHESVTITDTGLLPGAPGTRPFDGEGVPTRETVVVKKGVLTHFLTDTYSARKLGMKSTGNASGPNNFYLHPGNVDPEKIIRTVDRGLLLTGTIGQGLVPVTGDFSRGAFGLWIEKGEIAYPVAEITISGNMGDLLRNIELIGNDLEFKRSISGPTVKVSEMTVGGT